MYGFKGHKYKDLPLFINLRIKSPDARIYTLLADDIKVLKNYYQIRRNLEIMVQIELML